MKISRVNVVQLSGNLSQPFTHCHPKGEAEGKGNGFLGSTLAFNNSYLNAKTGQWQATKAAFFSIIVTDSQLQQYVSEIELQKGDFIQIAGRLKQRSDGQCYIVVNEISEFVRCKANEPSLEKSDNTGPEKASTKSYKRALANSARKTA